MCQELDTHDHNEKNALETALPGTTIKIKSKDQSTTYNGIIWRGPLTVLDVTRMYEINVDDACEIVLEGVRINPAERAVTIISGVNWIGFPLVESMSLNNAFAGFAASNDMVKSKGSSSSYNGSSWRGTLQNLIPGQGYIYKSNVQGNRTFTFPSQRIHIGD